MPETGWTKVPTMKRDISVRVAQVESEHDCQGVGHLCRECIIALANAVYDSLRHPPPDGQAPSKTDAKRKLEAFVAAELPGSHTKEIRDIVRAAFDLANAVQHRQGATPRDAALAAETTVALVNLISIVAGRHPTEAIPPKPERRAMTVDERERVVEGLANPYAARAIETLKTLYTEIETVEVEKESGVMRLLNKIVRVENDDRGRLALRAMNLMLQVEESGAEVWWARELRKTCLQMCHEPRPHPIAFEALQLLSFAPEEEDITWISYLIVHWPDDLYRITNPIAWLKALRNHFRPAVDEMLHSLVDPSVPAPAQERARELLDALRQGR